MIVTVNAAGAALRVRAQAQAENLKARPVTVGRHGDMTVTARVTVTGGSVTRAPARAGVRRRAGATAAAVAAPSATVAVTSHHRVAGVTVRRVALKLPGTSVTVTYSLRNSLCCHESGRTAGPTSMARVPATGGASDS